MLNTKDYTDKILVPLTLEGHTITKETRLVIEHVIKTIAKEIFLCDTPEHFYLEILNKYGIQ